MTLKEFLDKNPAAIDEAAKCKNIDEFKSLTEKAGITFDSEDKLEKAYETIKNNDATELSDDALDAVSGGSARVINRSDIFYNEAGEMIVRGKGKKA